MSSQFQNRVVVVTGASSGVSRAITRRFGAEGAKLALIARRAAADELRELGATAKVFCLDVSDAGAVEDVAQQVNEDWVGIDVWVNNAMVSVFSPIREMVPEEYRRAMEVNYLGYVHGTLAALVSDFLLERLYDWGVRRVCAYPGDGINGTLGAFGRLDARSSNGDGNGSDLQRRARAGQGPAPDRRSDRQGRRRKGRHDRSRQEKSDLSSNGGSLRPRRLPPEGQRQYPGR